MFRSILRKGDQAVLRLIGDGHYGAYNYTLPEAESEAELRRELIVSYFQFQPPLWRIIAFRFYSMSKRAIFKIIRRSFGIMARLLKRGQ